MSERKVMSDPFYVSLLRQMTERKVGANILSISSAFRGQTLILYKILLFRVAQQI